MDQLIPSDLMTLSGVDISTQTEQASILSASVGSSIRDQEMTQHLQQVNPTGTGADTTVDAGKVIANAITDVRLLESAQPVMPQLGDDLEAALQQTFAA
jgi:hypothetical protein